MPVALAATAFFVPSTVPAFIGRLVLFTADMAVMGIWADHPSVVVVAIVVSGAFTGNDNTLITEAVVRAAPGRAAGRRPGLSRVTSLQVWTFGPCPCPPRSERVAGRLENGSGATRRAP